MEPFPIKKIPFEEDVPMLDVMEGCQCWFAQLDEHGSVSLMDVMPRFYPEGSTCDYAICQAARISYGKGTKSVSDDTALIRNAFEKYNSYLEKGLSRELARMMLPINIYTSFYWKMNLRNLLHMIGLRMDPHAQPLTQKYAGTIYQFVKYIFPIACKAFEDYNYNAVSLSALEIDAIRNKESVIDSKNKREVQEWKEKCKILGIE